MFWSFFGNYCEDTVDGQNLAPVDKQFIPHYLQGFIHPRWLFGILSINSITAAGKLGDFRADALATLAWSMGRSTIRDGALLDAIATRSIEVLHTKDEQMVFCGWRTDAVWFACVFFSVYVSWCVYEYIVWYVRLLAIPCLVCVSLKVWKLRLVRHERNSHGQEHKHKHANFIDYDRLNR